MTFLGSCWSILTCTLQCIGIWVIFFVSHPPDYSILPTITIPGHRVVRESSGVLIVFYLCSRSIVTVPVPDSGAHHTHKLTRVVGIWPFCPVLDQSCLSEGAVVALSRPFEIQTNVLRTIFPGIVVFAERAINRNDLMDDGSKCDLIDSGFSLLSENEPEQGCASVVSHLQKSTN